MGEIVIRRATATDHDGWAGLYAAYAVFYGVEQTPEMRARVWAWIHDPVSEVEAFVAEQDGRLVGLAHFRPFTRPLSATVAGFLDDLFVDPGARGSAAARRLLAAVKAEGTRRGWSTIRWLTAEDNYRARALYDRVGVLGRWRVYDMATD